MTDELFRTSESLNDLFDRVYDGMNPNPIPAPIISPSSLSPAASPSAAPTTTSPLTRSPTQSPSYPIPPPPSPMLTVRQATKLKVYEATQRNVGPGYFPVVESGGGER